MYARGSNSSKLAVFDPALPEVADEINEVCCVNLHFFTLFVARVAEAAYVRCGRNCFPCL